MGTKRKREKGIKRKRYKEKKRKREILLYEQQLLIKRDMSKKRHV